MIVGAFKTLSIPSSHILLIVLLRVVVVHPDIAFFIRTIFYNSLSVLALFDFWIRGAFFLLSDQGLVGCFLIDILVNMVALALVMI